MQIRNYTIEPLELLERVCDAYGFHQKIQLANHFNISASSLSNRYTRGTLSYDFAAICSLETGASLQWLLTGDGDKFEDHDKSPNTANTHIILNKFTLSEGRLLPDGDLSIDSRLFKKNPAMVQVITSEGRTYFIEQQAPVSDGTWLIEIDGSASIRELTLLPSRKVHVAGGKIPFECSIDEIKTLGRVVGIYTEVN
ncbi:helix-turn-helix domain-containing protein [Rouxiella badensis]|uniref:phage repressor protein CI n=1 Tax=Rouxiella badensis TaxID=1646377 RepID=UPI001D147C3E|nr:phage repressor protein CI [Rouxiella badensis]MCC3704137.1 helix-turn-helix domain-containing protein [Rouxiella badensis]